MLTDRIIAGLLAFALAFFAPLASAQSPIRGFPPGTFQSRAPLDPAPGSSPITWTVTDTTSGAIQTGLGLLTTVTVNNVAFNAGTAVVVVGGELGSSNTITGVTICGSTATQAMQTPNGAVGILAGIWYKTGISLGTCTVAITASGSSIVTIGFLAGTFTNFTANDAYCTHSAGYGSPQSCDTSLTVNASGIGLVIEAGVDPSSGFAYAGSQACTSDHKFDGTAFNIVICHIVATDTPSFTDSGGTPQFTVGGASFH